jgi:peptide/nickel transport system substrate-binding protein
MAKKAVWLILSCLLVVALVLASCGPAEVEEEEGKPVVGEVEEKEEPRYGGTLRILTVYAGIDPLSWDQADIAWMHNHSASPYAEMLLTGNLQKGDRGTGEFRFTQQAWLPFEVCEGGPGLAESWEILSDQNIIRLHIRKGVYWQEKPGIMTSRELTASDIVFSHNRIEASPKRIPLYYDWIDSWEAVDKYTVDIHYNEYCGNWGYRIGWGYYCMVSNPPELIENGDPADWKDVCGTGPFMLTDYVKGSSQTYTKNPNYWGTTVIDGQEYDLPFVDTVIWPIMPDESTRLAALRTGKVDIDEGVRWIYGETLEDTNPDLLQWTWLTTSPLSVAMRMDTKPFTDIRVRQALSMALNREEMLASAVYGNQGVILSFPYAADWKLFTPVDELPETASMLFDYNPTKAKQLLAEAGYPDGFQTNLVISSTGTTQTDIAAMLINYWDAIGVECELKPFEYAHYLSVMTSREYDQMYQISTGNGNPFSVLRKTYLPEQTWNPALFDDDWLTDTWTEAMSETNLDKQNQMLREMNVYVIEQCPYILLPVGNVLRYAWPWVKNYYGEHCAGSVCPGPIHSTIWIDEDMRTTMGY